MRRVALLVLKLLGRESDTSNVFMHFGWGDPWLNGMTSDEQADYLAHPRGHRAVPRVALLRTEQTGDERSKR